MASSKAFATTALLLLFFTMVSATSCSPKPPHPKHIKPPHPKPIKPPVVVPKYPTCPRDALKLGVCADLLGLVNVVAGSQLNTPCCSLLAGLADLEAAACLCTAIKANVLGINLNVDVSLSVLLNACGCKPPAGFKCY
ncbi:hypothetical protein QJS04_geneDACA012397 [Acorus gramineus]|uniref:Bifunctional inhibitor/plant lipid transfer protein/seed storage helical domain-containing protein n=1 Tax=Acorus gramineus TaxID=55184 RepID=A0AAV9B8R7_ACOGR|nr:hypothetical protein QJS04_geneDACA012397 [Acorus gramineus]